METNLFSYMDYRQFLRDAYAELKRTNRAFSYRYFAKKAGLRSPNYLKLVMDGQRNLSQDVARKFGTALSLNKQETRFFVSLVAMNQAKTTADRVHYYDQLSKVPQYRQTKKLERSQYDYYWRWYCVPIRELVAIPGFQEDPAWIAQQLRPPITEAQAQKAMSLLLALGMVQRAEDGRLVQAEPLVSTGAELRSLALARFHSEMLRLADGALQRDVEGSEREFGGVTLRLTQPQIVHLKRRLYEIRQEILQLEGADDGPEAVYHFAFQLFPVSQFNEEGP
jgi:uncharacterized protein (TIGR02147 family)